MTVYGEHSTDSVEMRQFDQEEKLQEKQDESDVPTLYSFANFGLVVNYSCVGLISGAFPATIYPFMQKYLNMQGYQFSAAMVLVMMPWSFKTFIGILSDSFPIFGYRRRPYMVLGWLLCISVLVIMAILPVAQPFYQVGEIAKHKFHPERRMVLNADAPESGSKYIVLMMLAALGYIISDVACDAMLMELAQREPESTRGSIQSTVYFMRTIWEGIAIILVGLSFSGQEYGGTFSWSLSFNQFMVILASCVSVAIPSSICLISEKKHIRESFCARLRDMWRIAKNRSIWQLMAYNFFSSLFSSFGSAAAPSVQRKWAHVTPINVTISSVLGRIIFAIALYLTKVYLLHTNWRKIIMCCTLSVIVLDSFVSFITIFDVYRNEWFWLGPPLLESLPAGIRFVVSTLAIVEIIEPGYEGATFGLISTIANLASPFSVSIYKNIDSYFNTFDKNIERDSTEVRWRVAYTFLIMYGMNFLSLIFLVLLPPQKKEAQELRKRGGSSVCAATIAFSLALFALGWSITINLLSIFESTACLRLAGGPGCK